MFFVALKSITPPKAILRGLGAFQKSDRVGHQKIISEAPRGVSVRPCPPRFDFSKNFLYNLRVETTKYGVSINLLTFYCP